MASTQQSVWVAGEFSDIKIGDTVDFGFQINSVIVVESITETDHLVTISGKSPYGKANAHNFHKGFNRAVRFLVKAGN